MTFIKLLLTLLVIKLAKCDKLVQTDSGPVRGKTVASGKVEAFLGIPYAEPPVGPLRFDKPVAKVAWKEVYEATQLPPACVQLDLGMGMFLPDNHRMSEDCLYLNIWVPQPKGEEERKTVMLSIYGGAFMYGSSDLPLYDGIKLAEYGDVVVVTINYRVGSLGFFAGFTDDAPGSQGLYDQVMAIQWVKDNAKHFGADPDNIVLFGSSAGAISISMHQISPLSKNLFKRAIVQSGSAVTPLFTDKNEMVKQLNKMYAELLSCAEEDKTTDKDPKDVVECLRGVPAEKFAEADTKVNKETLLMYPRIGNDFLPLNPIDLFRKGDFKNSEVMMGITKDEGTIFTLKLSDATAMFEKNSSKILNETTALLAMRFLLGKGFVLEEDEIFKSYLSRVNDETGYTYLKAASEAVGDYLFTCAKIFQAEYQSMRENPVFFYTFVHRSAASPFPEWMGVPHGEDLQYVFGNPMFGPFTEYEEELNRDVMDMWVTFAKTGNPNIPGGMAWPRYTPEDPKYFTIGQRDSVGVRPDNYRCERWRKLFQATTN